jgi:hypothetical protein
VGFINLNSGLWSLESKKRKGYTRRTSRRVAPACVTASVRAETREISADTKKSEPRTIHRAPPNLQPTNMRHHGLAITIIVSPCQTLRGQADREEASVNNGGSSASTREGTTSTIIDGSRPVVATCQQWNRRETVTQPPGGRPPPPSTGAYRTQQQGHTKPPTTVNGC